MFEQQLDFDTLCNKVTFFEIEKEYCRLLEYEKDCDYTFFDGISAFFLRNVIGKYVDSILKFKDSPNKASFKEAMVFLLALYANILADYK